MKPRRALACLGLLVAGFTSVSAPGCSSGIGLAAPRAMNHPVDVAFACFDVSVPGSPRVAPLSSCALDVDVPSNTRQPPLMTQFHMHALVTQSTRGEVGAVDLIARGVLDSDMSVPGYTFVPVGQLPTVIIVPPVDVVAPMDPRCTYVASRGPVDDVHPGITIIDTRRFRSGAGLDHNPFPLFPPYVLPSAPSDMVLAPDAQSLWVTMDALGVLVRIPIESSCVLGEIDLVVPLDEDVPPTQPFIMGTTADTSYVCPATFVPIQPDVHVAPRMPDVTLDTLPEPVAIEIDALNGMLLIADRGLPMIHRVNMADGTLASPIPTGVPVRDVVATPLVPDSYQLVADPDIAPDHSPPTCPVTGLHAIGDVVPAPASSITFSRYVYAIDDTDGTVMAIEYTGDPTTNPGFGEVIPVDVVGARRADRLSMPIVARSLSVITPQYDTSAADPRFGPANADLCDPALMGNPNGYGLCLPSDAAESAAPSPTVLRGVFLVVSGADGALRFVDIYDLDAPCRGRTFGSVAVTVAGDGTLSDACTNPTVIGDEAVYIRRHRPRTQQILTTFLDTTIGPTVYFASGGNSPLDINGRAVGEPPHVPCSAASQCSSAEICNLESGQCESESQIPELRPIPGGVCPDNLSPVWPSTTDMGPPVYCSLVDPFALIAETWSATYEATIPGTFTASANARFDNAPLRMQFSGDFDTRLDYCQLGVIGRLDAETDIMTDANIAAGPERFHDGDMLAITGVMPETSLDNMEICRHVVGIDVVGQTQLPVLVRIEHAFTSPPGIMAPYTGRIHVDPAAALEDRAFADPTRHCTMDSDCASTSTPRDTCDLTASTCISVPTISDAIDCYGDTLLTIDVRSYHAFTVSGTRSGFHTRIVRRADGSCHFDGSLPELRQGYAFNDQLFSNGRVAFVPSGTGTRTIANQLAEIRMVLTNGPSQLGIDLSLSTTGARTLALPTGVRYSNEMWALYAIETERRGLVEMTLRPLAVTATAYQ